MKSDPDREITIFTEACKFPFRERNAFLERMCGGDENLRRRLEALLRAYDRSARFLEEPAIVTALGSLRGNISTPANRLIRRKARDIFQHRARKRK